MFDICCDFIGHRIDPIQRVGLSIGFFRLCVNWDSIVEGDIGFSDFWSLCLRRSSTHCPSETLGVVDMH
ncbi:hypothetical protein K1719_007570 [Acacia pycnantha]|nr:hypothetical protein K1719_007570 [Acacia pycnantha]